MTSSAQDLELQKQAYQFFIEEAVELLELIDRGLESILTQRTDKQIHEISRAAHSLKGGARSAGLEDLGNIALRVEKTFKALYNEEIIIDGELETHLRQLYQTLRNPLSARIENREWDEKAELAQANSIWQEIEAKLGHALAQAGEYLPSSSDLGIDIATSIFEVDVAAGIEHLREVMADAQNELLAEELTTQIEVFSGFGEMLALPGFTQICQTAGEALAKYPERVLSITQCFLANITLAKEQVLAGDRQTGGTVSPELLTLASAETKQTSPTDLSSSEQVEEIKREEDLEHPIDTSDRAYSFFVQEAPELLQIIESGLLTIKEERTTAKIHEIMRAAHSLKGGAATVGLEAIKTIAHKLEDIFKCLYNQEVEIDTNLESWLLEGYDCLSNPLTEQINTGSYHPQQALDQADRVWAKIETVLGDTLKRAGDYLPSSSDLGVDIVASMFEVDVEQELQRLRQVVSSPDSYPLAAELRATLEVFAGFGEMLNLPGFAEIAHNGLIALEKNPHRPLEIIRLIINDVETARNLVLKGDRHRGGEPSEALLSLAEGERSSPKNHPSLEDVFGEGKETDPHELLAEEKMEVPSLEEIFGDEAEITELMTTDNTEEEDRFAPSLEKVFGIDLDGDQLVQIYEELETEGQEELEIPSLEAIFIAELSQNEIDILEQANKEDLESEEENQSPSLEDIFGTADLTGLEIEENNQPETENDDQSPRLEDLFANQDLVWEISDDETEERTATQPSIEDVFGDFSPTAKQSTSLPNQPPETKIKTPETLTPSTNDLKTSQQTNQQKLAEAVKSIGKLFVDLPSIQQESEIKSSEKKQPSPLLHQPPVHKKSQSSSQKKANLTIKVDLERLERMNNIIGELSINRNGLSLQNDKLQNALKELLNRFANFSQMAGNLREMSDQMLIAPEKFGKKLTPGVSITPYLDRENLDADSSFDSLEMDSYDSMYYVVQSLIEQIIQLEEAVDDIALFAKQSGRTVEDQRQMVNNIRDELMWARMLPLSEILNRFPRVLRDLSLKYQKPVNLKLTGTGVLVDRAALEKLYDPLVHLLRNAFDHGIESQEVRKKQGKPEEGIIEIKAYHQGNQTVIEIKDDGGGLNVEKIGHKAVEIGLLSPEQLAVISKNNLLDLIFEPGFSTAAKVTEISGRGVGLDIVRSQLRSLKGIISVDSTQGKGTNFILKLPLTLTIDKLLVLLAGSNFFALPSDNIEEILVPESDQIKTSGHQRFLYYENEIIPIYPLTELLNYNCHTPNYMAMKSLAILPVPEDWGNPILLLRQRQQLFALEVDRLVSEQELVIKPFGSALTAPKYTYGCTVLGDGSLIPVINGSVLLEYFFSTTQEDAALSSTPKPVALSSSSQSQSLPATAFQVPWVLVVDDSAAMRRTLALSLEKAGYRVLQAKDGKEAIDQLTKNSQISLVICDIEMPNMNGFEFLGQRRRNLELMKIPVAMLTSRSNDKHRKLATHLGADAYFTKPYIEQKFLASLKTMINKQTPLKV